MSEEMEGQMALWDLDSEQPDEQCEVEDCQECCLQCATEKECIEKSKEQAQ